MYSIWQCIDSECNTIPLEGIFCKEMRIIKIYHVNIYGFWCGKYENFNMFTFLSLHNVSTGETADVFADTFISGADFCRAYCNK